MASWLFLHGSLYIFFFPLRRTFARTEYLMISEIIFFFCFLCLNRWRWKTKFEDSFFFLLHCFPLLLSRFFFRDLHFPGIDHHYLETPEEHITQYFQSVSLSIPRDTCKFRTVAVFFFLESKQKIQATDRKINKFYVIYLPNC